MKFFVDIDFMSKQNILPVRFQYSQKFFEIWAIEIF